MRKQLLLLTVLVAFSAYTLLVMVRAEQSLLQFGLQLMSSADTAQVVIDLYIMAGLACAWMVRDNRARGKPHRAVAPYILLTLVFVSIGPLSYLILRDLQGDQRRHADL